jgi:hypothetical protein
VSGRAVKPSASGGTEPDQTGQAGAWPRAGPGGCPEPSADIKP